MRGDEPSSSRVETESPSHLPEALLEDVQPGSQTGKISRELVAGAAPSTSSASPFPPEPSALKRVFCRTRKWRLHVRNLIGMKHP